MKILVTGSTGQVGQSLMSLGETQGFSMFGFSSSQLDISNIKNVDAVFSQIKPGLVVNAAAYTAVDKAESDTANAYAVNELGPKLLANACKKNGVPLLHISTDYVFDGVLDRPYLESDAPNPKSVYGRSKLLGESAVREILDEHVILRTSWVFSQYGNNFVKTMIRLGNERKELSVVCDQFGGPTSASAIADVLMRMAREFFAKKSLPWGTFHFSQFPHVSWYDFAKLIFEKGSQAGLTNNIHLSPISSEDYPVAAFRPKNSRLDNILLNDTFSLKESSWIESLDDVLEELKA